MLLPSVPCRTIPGTPAQPTTTALPWQPLQRQISWTAVASSDPDCPVTGYSVVCASGSGALPTLTVDASATGVVVSGLASNIAYTCTVAVITGAGSGQPSVPSAVFTTPEAQAINRYPIGPGGLDTGNVPANAW
jgi:hypothetical protein